MGERPKKPTERTTTSDDNGMSFIPGIVVAVVAILAYFIFVDGNMGVSDDVNFTIEGAGDAIEGAVEGATE